MSKNENCIIKIEPQKKENVSIKVNFDELNYLMNRMKVQLYKIFPEQKGEEMTFECIFVEPHFTLQDVYLVDDIERNGLYCNDRDQYGHNPAHLFIDIRPEVEYGDYSIIQRQWKNLKRGDHLSITGKLDFYTDEWGCKPCIKRACESFSVNNDL